MIPDAATASPEELWAFIETCRFWVLTLVALSVFLMVGIWRLVSLLERGCPNCDHCQKKIRDEEERKKKEIEENRAYWDRTQDEYIRRRRVTTSKKEQSPEEIRERLFGRQVSSSEDEDVVSSESGTSRDEGGNA